MCVCVFAFVRLCLFVLGKEKRSKQYACVHAFVRLCLFVCVSVSVCLGEGRVGRACVVGTLGCLLWRCRGRMRADTLSMEASSYYNHQV